LDHYSGDMACFQKPAVLAFPQSARRGASVPSLAIGTFTDTSLDNPSHKARHDPSSHIRNVTFPIRIDSAFWHA
jgi:hypothetical protein